MQWNYDKGFSMKHHQTIEGMPAHQRDIILTELMKKFVMVPIFSQTSNDFLRVRHSKIKIYLKVDIPLSHLSQV